MRDGWKKVAISDVCIMIKRGQAPSYTENKSVTVLNQKCIRDGRINLEFSRQTDANLKPINEWAYLNATDTLVNSTGVGTLGRVAFVRNLPEPTTVDSHVTIVRPDNKKVEPSFLGLSLNFREADIEGLAAGSSGQTELSREALGNLIITLPTLPEQKRIVDLISSVDSYVEALEQQLASARSASNAQLEKIISEFNDDWVEVTLGEVLEISRGGSPRPIQEYLTDSEDGINWVKIADATRSEKYIYSTLQKIKKEGISRSREVFSGDFILSNSMSFGRPYIMRTDGCIHDGWLLLSKVSNRFDEDFLYNLLNSDYVQRQFESLAAGSGVRNLNIEVVKKVKVKIPTIEVQRELASIINEFDNFIIKLTRQLHSGMDLRQALLSDLLSGTHEIPVTYDKVMGAA